ncbi:MAG: type II toxin-antitoxin system mRNA interferase toxin, RelE/StbE family [Patescibacteria group bacterium]
MIVKYDTLFIERFKKLDVRIRKSLKEKIAIFQENPFDPQLNNHPLKDEYVGYRSIDVTADYRAIYEEMNELGEPVAYFVAIGTHPELYD